MRGMLMAVVDEIIRLEEDGTISFGDYLSENIKSEEKFKAKRSFYNVETNSEATKLTKSGKILFESAPGATVHNFSLESERASFGLEGVEDVRVAVLMNPAKLYRIKIDENVIGNKKSDAKGKLVFSLELDETVKQIEITEA